MLWTTIGILTLLLIFGLGAQALYLKQGQRLRWFLGLMGGWGANAAAGTMVFVQVYRGDIDIADYWVWKPLLVGSSILFMCLSAACFYVVRHVSSEETAIFRWKNRMLLKTGLSGFLLGTSSILWLWFWLE